MGPAKLEQGIRNNLKQFMLLVLTNLFVGAMVGQERSILTLIAREEFGIASKTAALSFLVSFGTSKAFCNLFAGGLADRLGRRKVLIWGWVFGLPVPLVLIFADQWLWIILGNILLGINQALCWSATVIMKLDLAGPRRAGLATAANEWAGYVGVAIAAGATGFLAATYGLRPVPFYLGLGLAVAGLLVSSLLIRPTRAFAELEAEEAKPGVPTGGKGLSPGAVVIRTTWSDRNLLAASQAGLCTNLKDGLIWGLLPIYLQGSGLSTGRIGIIAAVYPAVWGFGQLGTGPLSDRIGRKWLIAGGMAIQGMGLLLFLSGTTFPSWLAAAVVVGLGTALAYPVLLAAVADIAPPAARGSILGGYRFWRDAGYAVSGLGIGPASDAFGPVIAIAAVAALTIISGLAVVALMAPHLRRVQ